MRFGLKEDTIEKIRTVFSRFTQVKKAVLYGSRARGNYKNGSDIDLTLYGGNDLTLDVMYRIINELDDQHLPYTIDLSIVKQITDPDVLDHIQRVGIMFYDMENLCGTSVKQDR
ncbi:MAG: nucleotidyltransferase domain-containing protein [Deltaproteobacteria bacterium]|nr:nucleotidyltransferase domain-containing protein [Deltaproteobacteria bacterium]